VEVEKFDDGFLSWFQGSELVFGERRHAEPIAQPIHKH
jgi:hypothetical protein